MKPICEKCKLNNYEVRKNGSPRFTLIWDSQVSDMKRFAFCKTCRLDFEKRKRESNKRQRELEKAPLGIIKDLLTMKAGEEWNLKLSDAEYYIKCVK